MNTIVMEFGNTSNVELNAKDPPKCDADIAGAAYMGEGPQGPPGRDGLTTSVTVNGVTHEQVNGRIDLGNFSSLPEVTVADNNKIMRVIDGDWALTAYYTITANPSGGNTLNL